MHICYFIFSKNVFFRSKVNFPKLTLPDAFEDSFRNDNVTGTIYQLVKAVDFRSVSWCQNIAHRVRDAGLLGRFSQKRFPRLR